MYIIPVLPLLLFVLSSQPSDAADDNPVTVRFHCQRGCCDHHEWCRFWASVGECRSNREWMADNCQLVCGSCRPGSARTARPPDASSLARPPPRMPRPGTSQASNPRPSNPRPVGRRPASRTTPRDRPSVQARPQDRRPQRPASTTLPRTTPRTTQRILPFSRATRPLRTRPSPSLNDTLLHGISSRRQSANRTTTRPLLHARGQQLNSSQVGMPVVTSTQPFEMENRRPFPPNPPQVINGGPERSRIPPQPQASPHSSQAEESRPQPALPQPPPPTLPPQPPILPPQPPILPQQPPITPPQPPIHPPQPVALHSQIEELRLQTSTPQTRLEQPRLQEPVPQIRFDEFRVQTSPPQLILPTTPVLTTTTTSTAAPTTT
ncbi:shTK domain protein, partial [Ostertagia ostertagi]